MTYSISDKFHRPITVWWHRQNTRIRLISMGAIFLTGCSMALPAQNDRKEDKKMIGQQVMELMIKLDTLDERSQMKLLSQVDEQRIELLGVLLKHLGTSTSKNVQAGAIYLIGRHRLAGGVGELIRRIDFNAGSESKLSALRLWERYPAMEALITIGKPSVSSALELLATDINDLRRTLAVKVVRYVEGADIAMFILQKTHTSEQDSTRKAKLADAVARLQQLISETR